MNVINNSSRIEILIGHNHCKELGILAKSERNDDPYRWVFLLLLLPVFVNPPTMVAIRQILDIDRILRCHRLVVLGFQIVNQKILKVNIVRVFNFLPFTHGKVPSVAIATHVQTSDFPFVVHRS